jgi:hypothetical protein
VAVLALGLHELHECDEMSDPFAETPTPRWKRGRAKATKRTPRRQAAVAGGLGGLVTFALAGHHSLAKALLVGAVAALPSALLEAWHKGRHRRREDRLCSCSPSRGL